MNGMNFHHVHESESHFVGEKNVSYSWGSDNDQDQKYVNLCTVEGTGEVESVYVQDDSSQGKEVKISLVDARLRAQQFIQKYLQKGQTEVQIVVYPSYSEMAPDWVDKSKLTKEEMPDARISFQFYPLHQGIPVRDSNYSVVIDQTNGKVVQFSLQAMDPSVTLPDAQRVVAAEAAKQEYLKNNPLQLAYIWPEWHEQKGPAPYLVYMPYISVGWSYIDALIGKTIVVEE
ncbi:hypothetical protein Dred_0595 [Desulforamulus reducens MI-1]|uniref:YcdB/YcdC repeated domain-containing protein n=2 Tax=Desulforamulus TaxID=2916693 RepID=A4J234_DESRM|nr:hypothetical protein Dred_0595 [Desulforamulus reducens MI-1]